MRWAKLTQHRTEIEIDGKNYHVLAEQQDDEEFAISIDGEYLCDTANLPSREDITKIIEMEMEIERRTVLVDYPK